MKKFKGIAGISATFMLSLSVLLTGCSSSSSSQTTNSSANGNGTITINEMDSLTTHNDAMDGMIKDFEKAHPNIKVQRITVPYDSIVQKVLQAASSNSLPDLLAVDNPFLQSLTTSGALVPLDQLGKVDTSNYFKGSLTTVTTDNKLFGLPIGNNNLALFYNKKLLQEANLTPPKTWDELYNDTKVLTKGSTYGMAVAAPNTEEATWQFDPFLWSNGGSVRHIDSPQSIQALDLYVKMFKNGYISKSALNWNQADEAQQFAQGNAAMMISGPFEFPVLDKATNLDYGIVPVPLPSADKKPITPLGGHVFTIPKTTPDKEKAAFEFLQWLQQPQNLIKVNKALGWIPASIPAAQQLAKDEPRLQPFIDEFNTARARTMYLGPNYPKASEAVWTGIQSAITGTKTPEQAFKDAQATINGVIKQ